MSKQPVIGVMGPSEATKKDLAHAEKLGALIAQNGWITLSGGVNAGVMDTVSRGAAKEGGFVVGVLPGANKESASIWLSIAIISGIGSARNNVNILSSDAVVACGTLSAGTLSEVSLAINAGKQILLLGNKSELSKQIKKLASKQITMVETPEAAIRKLKAILKAS